MFMLVHGANISVSWRQFAFQTNMVSNYFSDIVSALNDYCFDHHGCNQQGVTPNGKFDTFLPWPF